MRKMAHNQYSGRLKILPVHSKTDRLYVVRMIKIEGWIKTMKKVLVVDDTKNIRMMLTKCLELEGCEVMTARDGRQALEMVAVQAFDLIFLDIKLPEIRGTEVLKRMRVLGIKTPVIIITAYATVKNAVDCTNLGAVAYVQKPFSMEKIKSVLRELDNKPIYGGIEKLISDARESIREKAFSDALRSLKRALSVDIENPEIYLLVSEAYEGLGNSESAERFRQFYKLFKS